MIRFVTMWCASKKKVNTVSITLLVDQSRKQTFSSVERRDCEGTSAPPLCFPLPSHPTAETEDWLGCEEAEGAAAWGAGSQGRSLGWHVTRSTGFLDSLPAAFHWNFQWNQHVPVKCFNSVKSAFSNSIPLENFQPALVIRASLSSHTGVLLKDIKFPSQRPWAKSSPCLHPTPQPWTSPELSATAGWGFSLECHHLLIPMWELHWHCPTAGTTSLMWPNTRPQQRPFVLCLGKVRIFWRFEEILIVLIYHRSQKVLSSNHEQRFSYVCIYIYISDLLSLNLFFFFSELFSWFSSLP